MHTMETTISTVAMVMYAWFITSGLTPSVTAVVLISNTFGRESNANSTEVLVRPVVKPLALIIGYSNNNPRVSPIMPTNMQFAGMPLFL